MHSSLWLDHIVYSECILSFPALVSPSFIRLNWPIMAWPEVAWGNFGRPSRFLRGVVRNLLTKSCLSWTWRLRRTSQTKQRSNFRNCFVALRTSLLAVIVFLAGSALKIQNIVWQLSSIQALTYLVLVLGNSIGNFRNFSMDYGRKSICVCLPSTCVGPWGPTWGPGSIYILVDNRLCLSFPMRGRRPTVYHFPHHIFLVAIIAVALPTHVLKIINYTPKLWNRNSLQYKEKNLLI